MVMSLTLPNEAQIPDSNGVRLTATILSQYDCKTGPKYHSLFLGVKLQLQNNAGLPLEVAFPLSGTVILSRTLADAKTGKHEFEMNGAESPGHPSSETMPRVEYRLIAPGGSIESVLNNLQLVPAEEGKPDGLKPGRHYFQIQIGGFFKKPGSTDSASGYQKITSAPVPFEVERYPVPIDCPEIDGK